MHAVVRLYFESVRGQYSVRWSLQYTNHTAPHRRLLLMFVHSQTHTHTHTYRAALLVIENKRRKRFTDLDWNSYNQACT